MTDTGAEPLTRDPYNLAVLAQAEAADPIRSAWVEANAGSGKTKVLIDRVARLLLRKPDGRPGAKPDSILCITYTKAAANEMLTRLFERLGDWSVMADAPLAQRLATLEGRAPGDYGEEDLKAARRLFARALETPGGLRIETIHAFCARVLRRFPLEAGVLPGFTEIEDTDAADLWAEAKADAVLAAERIRPDILDCLAREGGHGGAMQALDQVRSRAGVLLAFEETLPDPSTIAAAVRSALNAPDASRETLLHTALMEGLPADIIGAAIPVLQASTVKKDIAFAQKLSALVEASDADQRYMIARSIFRIGGGEGDFGKANPYSAGTLKRLPGIAIFAADNEAKGVVGGAETHRFKQLEQDLSLIAAVTRTDALLQIGLPALKAYRAKKTARAMLDFDDLIEKTRDLLTQRQMTDWVLYKLDGGLSHILLDEAQDTSPAQWELINALSEEFTAGQGVETPQDPRTQFVVGDVKQSIYSFQGADPARFRAEGQQFSGRVPDAARRPMEMSFRSSPEILRFVDQVWNEAPAIDVAYADHPPLTTDRVSHAAFRGGQPGSVELWPVTRPAEDTGGDDAWQRPLNAVTSSSPKARLAKAIALAVEAMIDSGEAVWAPGPDGQWARRAMRPEDVLILVRSRTGGLFDALIDALKAQGLPVAGADRLVLADHIGVQDCLNLLRFALLPSDDLTVAEIMRGPFGGLVDDDRYLYPLAYGRKQTSLWARIRQSDDPDVMVFSAFLEGIYARRSLPPFEFLSSVLDKTQPGGRTGWQMVTARLGLPARDPIEALLSRALAQDARAPASLQRFVSAMDGDASQIKRDLAAPEREVRIMTVHGAKGLQAPVVILPDTTAKPKPGGGGLFDVDGTPIWAQGKANDTPETAAARALSDARAEEEHRRLLYVALTRAQDRLVIAGHWYGATSETATGYHERSWYGLCHQAMVDMPDHTEDGEVLRLGAPPHIADAASRAGAGVTALPDWVLRPATAERSADARLAAPSGLVGPKTPVLAPFGKTRAARMARGRIIHALLQYLPELQPDRREDAARGYLASDMSLTESQRHEILTVTLSTLNDPDLADIFATGGRAEAGVIGGAPELPPGMVINGRVDRLVVSDDAVMIIDFKTDQPAPDTPAGVAATYIAQMAAYWAVLRAAYPGRSVTAALCWTDGPKLMALPDELLLAQLNSLDCGV